MGTPNHGWILTRTNNNPLPGPYVSHQIRCSPENKVQITTEVQELLDKGAILGDTTNTTELCVSNFFWYKNEWGSETSDKPKGSQSISEDRAFQDWRSSFTTRQAWGNYTMQWAVTVFNTLYLSNHVLDRFLSNLHILCPPYTRPYIPSLKKVGLAVCKMYVCLWKLPDFLHIFLLLAPI